MEIKEIKNISWAFFGAILMFGLVLKSIYSPKITTILNDTLSIMGCVFIATTSIIYISLSKKEDKNDKQAKR